MCYYCDLHATILTVLTTTSTAASTTPACMHDCYDLMTCLLTAACLTVMLYYNSACHHCVCVFVVRGQNPVYYTCTRHGN